MADDPWAAFRPSKGVLPNGMLPGQEGNLDRSKAGDNWATFELSEEGIPKHYVLPTQPGDRMANDATGFMGDAVERFRKTKQHYGAFDSDEAGAAFMKTPQSDPWASFRSNAVASKDPTATDYAIDAARSIPGGLAKGVSALAGAPGDLNNLLQAGAGKVAEFLGLESPEQAQAITEKLRSLNPVSSESMNAAASAPTGGFYEPRTAAGRTAETVAEFAPAALGPGGAVARTARVLTPALTSAAARETARVVAPDLEPYAQAGGAFLGGIGQGLTRGMLAERAASRAIPNQAALRNAAQAEYRNVDQAGVGISGASFNRAVADIENSPRLQAAGVNPRIPAAAQARLYPKASAALETLRDAANGQAISLPDIDRLRQTARIALESPDRADRRVAHIIIDGLDQFVDNLTPADMSLASHTQNQLQIDHAYNALNNARQLWARSAKADAIERVVERARNSSVSFDRALRSRFRAFVGNEAAMRQFTPAERATLRTAARGTFTGQTLEQLGRLSPVKGGWASIAEALTAASGAAAAHGAAGVIPAAGVALAGETARQGSRALALRDARIASDLVRSGGIVTRSTAAPVLAEGGLSALIGKQKVSENRLGQLAGAR